jgi:thermostable 8-oxoguanine DNA glycosylase
MVDPMNITKFDRTEAEMQEFAIFAVCVAGKTAKTIAPRVSRLIENISKLFKDVVKGELPLDYITYMTYAELAEQIKEVGIGCFNQKADSIWIMARRVKCGALNLSTATPEQLEQIRGIGAKTSRFFILHSRKDAKYAALDTHILKHLTAHGIPNVPKSTPPKGRLYTLLENAFLLLADKAGMSPADYDLMVWRHYASGVPLTAA